MFEDPPSSSRISSEDCFAIWAPESSPWSPWAKPVLFASEPGFSIEAPVVVPPFDVRGLPEFWSGSAVVLNLPGEESVLAGLALAERGCRPVPLYNGTDGPDPVVNIDGIARAIGSGAPVLKGMSIPSDASPIFLLDANRLDVSGAVQDSYYDNRWVVLPQDFPSATFLLSRGITGVTLVQRGETQPAEDLAHVMLRWQQGGIALRSIDLKSSTITDPLTVREPSLFRKAWYAAITMVGLRRSNVGGFGSFVPEQTSGSGGFYG